MKSDVNIIENWLREPDLAEKFSLVEMATWINQRPLQEFYRIKKELEANGALSQQAGTK